MTPTLKHGVPTRVRNRPLRPRRARVSWLGRCLAIVALTAGIGSLDAANHLDTPTVIMNPRADIGDVFAWMSSDGRRLNLVMTIVGHTLSPELTYVFHVDSGAQFGTTTATIEISCRFKSMNAADCRAGDIDRVGGDASGLEGLNGRSGRFRVFAGMRDDPFVNNVRGSRAAYEVATAALRAGASLDAASYPQFSADTAVAVLKEWRHTEGGPGKDFLAGWTPASIVIAIDRDVVAVGGNMLAVWAVTRSGERQLDRMGRPLTENSLLATLGPQLRADELKERFNATTPASSGEFVPEIEKGLALYDSFDGRCGNQLLADRAAAPTARYRKLAQLLADDRLWVNAASSVCKQFFAVELAHAAGQRALANDCGGRTINQDAIDVYRSLLVNGTMTGVDDGVDSDERKHSVDVGIHEYGSRASGTRCCFVA